jgi:hypothetical protein
MYRADGKAVWETIGTLDTVPKVEKARELADRRGARTLGVVQG